MQITDNSYWDVAPLIGDNGDAVWSRDDGNDWEVFLYKRDTKRIVPLSDNDYQDYYPAKINARGDVVWRATLPGSDDEIF